MSSTGPPPGARTAEAEIRDVRYGTYAGERRGRAAAVASLARWGALRSLGARRGWKAKAVPITLIRGFPTVEAIGLYPTWETVGAQMLLLALFVFAVAKTFWPKRSVSLPTVGPAAGDTQSLVAQIEALRGDNEALKARLAVLERRLSS